MNITLHTPEQIAKMRIAGRLAAEVLEMIEPYVKPGVTTNTLNDICHRYITETQQAIPAPPLITEVFLNLFAPLSITKFAMAFLMTSL